MPQRIRRSAAPALLAALATLAPVRGWAQSGPPAFSTVFQSFTVAGCGGGTFNEVCASGLATFGRLSAPDIYGLRLDVRTVLRQLNPLETITSLSLQQRSYGQFSTAPVGGSCGGLILSGGLCRGALELFQVSSSGDLSGQNPTTAFVTLPLTGSAFVFGGDPATFRLAALTLVYDGSGLSGSPPTTGFVSVVVPVAVTPEPTTLALAGAGAGVSLLAAWARRRTS